MAQVRIKICGVTTPEDITAIAEEGADAIGVNFYPKSPRYVDPRTAMSLLTAASPMMSLVGVFVAQPLRQVYAISYQLGIRGVQWYGEPSLWEPPFPFALIPAFRVKVAADLIAIDTAIADAQTRGIAISAVLVDSLVEGQMGGTGHRAPWELLAQWKPTVPLILAGGLRPDNVAEAIRLVRPAGVDVASGVESAPGRKDRVMVRDFIQAARSAALSLI